MTAEQIAESIDEEIIRLQDRIVALDRAAYALRGMEHPNGDPTPKPKRAYKKRTKPSTVQPVEAEAVVEAPATSVPTKKNGTKLTQEIADEIRLSNHSASSLASLYGVSETTVRNIKAGRTWAPDRKAS